MPTSDQTPGDRNAQAGDPSPVDLDYELIRIIGKGGYGEVWLVRDKAGEYRACKVVHRESFQNDRPYEREYEGICKFEPVSRGSESQVKILHVGRRDEAGCFYYIMELADEAEGNPAMHPESYVPKTLRSEMQRRGRLPVGECIEIGLSLSAALENLHQHGLIHRDIKPANIIFVKGVPKLADIGLVTEADVTVSYVGTEGFIPPEGPTSLQADIYGLGKVLYEISTGKDRLEYPELPVDFGDLPDREQLLELNAVVAQACAANCGNRYASAKELRTDLSLLRTGKSVRQIRSAKKKWGMVARAAAALAVLLAVVAGFIYFPRPQADRNGPLLRISVPDAARTAQCETKIKEDYQSQLNSGTSAVKQTAAAELVKRASSIEDPAMQLASLRVAALLAEEAEDFSSALQICETMAERFQIDPLSVKADMVTQASNYARSTSRKTQLAGVSLKAGFETIAADDYSNGVKFAGLATSLAQNCGDARLAQEAEFLNTEMTRCRDRFDLVKPFETILRTRQGDPEASLAVGKFLCFVKNDWEAGLPLMARGTNESLNAVVAMEITARPKTSAAEISLASLWRGLAGSSSDEEKVSYQQRARYWYLKGLAAARKEDRERLQQQVNEWIQTVPTEPAEVHIFSRLDGTESIDIYADEVRWKAGRGAVTSKINQIKLDDLKPGDLVIIKNSEATRLLPEAVDFSTARLIINHKPKAKWLSRARLEKAPDHVRVVLTHPGNGFVEVDVTVSFGSQP